MRPCQAVWDAGRPQDRLLASGNFRAHLIKPELMEAPAASGSEGGTHSTDEETEAILLGSGRAQSRIQPLSSSSEEQGLGEKAGSRKKTRKGGAGVRQNIGASGEGQITCGVCGSSSQMSW